MPQAKGETNLLLQVSISAPEEISPGVFRTSFTHPDLLGSLYLIHGKSRDRVMKGLDQSLEGAVGNLVSLFKELAHDSRQQPKQGKVGEGQT